MLGYLPLIAKNCWRNRRRTTLTILSIAASLSLLGIFMAIYAAFYLSEPTPQQALRLATVNKVPLIFPVTLEFTVRGIYDSDENNENLYFDRKYLDESVNGAMKNMAGMFIILADSADSVPRIARAIDDEFSNSTTHTKTETERVFQLAFINAMGNVKAFLLSICAAVTFTVLLVSGNTMAMSVRERVREVGVLKTLGFTREAILGMILGEAVTLAIVGGAIGIALASGLCDRVR